MEMTDLEVIVVELVIGCALGRAGRVLVSSPKFDRYRAYADDFTSVVCLVLAIAALTLFACTGTDAAKVVGDILFATAFAFDAEMQYNKHRDDVRDITLVETCISIVMPLRRALGVVVACGLFLSIAVALTIANFSGHLPPSSDLFAFDDTSML